MFDLLHAAGALLPVPLVLWKALAQLFTSKPTHDLLVVESIPAAGLHLYAAALQRGQRCDSSTYRAHVLTAGAS
jgi:hypothetical protein